MVQRTFLQYTLGLCLILQACFAVVHAEDDMQTLVKKTLMKRLQKGGYTVFMLHAATDSASFDQYRFAMDNCDQQQQLTPLAENDLSQAASPIKSLNIQFLPIVVSPYCRTQATAELLIEDEFDVSPHLQVSLMANRQNRDTGTAFLIEHLNQIPQERNNTLVISHLSNLLHALPDRIAEPGDMLIFRPMPDKSTPKFLGIITLTDWQTLAPDVAQEVVNED